MTRFILPLVLTLLTIAFGVALAWVKRKLVRESIPDGCLGCNPVPVRRALLAAGADPSIFHELPPSRHAWSDIVPCPKCGRFWLVLPKEKRPS